MKRISVAATVCGLTIVACAAVAAADTAQTPGSAIAVYTCAPHQHAAGTAAHPWIDPYGRVHGIGAFPYYEGFLSIDYANQAKQPATEVDFGLVARGSLIAVAKDVGKFSPGVRIEHEFVIPGEVFPIGTAFPACKVLRVKYADGSSWRNPNPPPTG